MEFLRAKGPAGFPPCNFTDAHLGYPVRALQSAEIPFGSWEDGGSIPFRPEGLWARAHPGAGRELSLRAKVGH